jgi:hypothetical protein
MEKKRDKKYKAPVVMDLGKQARGSGFCLPGASQAEFNCGLGDAAGLGSCGSGFTATAGICSGGLAPIT